MADAPAIVINLPGYPFQNLSSTSAFAALRALPSAALVAGQDYAVDGSDAFGDGGGGLFVWAPSSMATDDDATVIKPSDLTNLQAGRWLLAGGKQLKGAEQAASDALAAALATLAAAGGAGLAGFDASQVYAAGTVGNHLKRVAFVTDAPFNAKCDGTTDDTTAVGAAITAAISAGGYTDIIIPGPCKITGSLPAITADHITIVGLAAAKLILSYDGRVFEFRGYGGGARNLICTYPAAPTANAVLFYQNGGDGQNFDVRIDNVGMVLKCGADDNSTIGNLANARVKGNVANIAVPAFKTNASAGLTLDPANSIYVKGVGNPAINRTSSMTVVSGRSLLTVGTATTDTIKIGGTYERFWRGLDLTASGASQAVLNVIIDPLTVFDYIADDIYHLEAQTGSGSDTNIQIAGYASSWSGRAVNILATAGVSYVDITGLYVPFSGYEAIKIDGAGASHIRLTRPRLVASDRLNTSVSAININGGSHITVLSAESGIDGTPVGLPWQSASGLKTAADLNFITVADCDCAGTTIAYDFGTNTSPSSNRRIRDNINANYAGLKTGGIYTLPATTVVWPNLTGFEIEITVGGGTVTGIQRNGSLTGMTSGSLTLLPGDNFTLTYSSAPTIQFYVKP